MIYAACGNVHTILPLLCRILWNPSKNLDTWLNAKWFILQNSGIAYMFPDCCLASEEEMLAFEMKKQIARRRKRDTGNL